LELNFSGTSGAERNGAKNEQKEGSQDLSHVEGGSCKYGVNWKDKPPALPVDSHGLTVPAV